MSVEPFSITLVGAGNMGGAMLSGWLDAGVPGGSIQVVDPHPHQSTAAHMSAAGVDHRARAPESGSTDVLILAVKPQIFDVALQDVRHLAGPATVTISVAAGIPIRRMESLLGARAGVVRAMPNTPSLIGRGITIACANGHTSAVQRERTETLLRTTGTFDWVEDESLIDAVTAVSGSGPAYVFHLAECMADAGVREGLDETLSMKLAVETIAGAGELLRRGQQSAEQLRRNVTSPNGTTQAALEVLMDREALRDLMAAAIHAARVRSEELSK